MSSERDLPGGPGDVPPGRPHPDDEFGLGLRTPPWNVVITARSGYRRKLRRGLSSLLRLQRSGYRNVLTALHEDPEVFLDALETVLADKPYLRTCISRLMTVERTFSVDPIVFGQQLETEIVPFLDRLAGRTFHVRLERRGHKGRIHSKDCEVRLGSFIYDHLDARGLKPVVKFDDPDAIIVVEIIDDRAGMRLLTRDDRTRHPLLRTD